MNRTKKLLLTAFVLALVAAVPASAQAKATCTVSTPKLSAAPVSGTPFTVSGVITPKATGRAPAVVKIKLYMLMDGHYDVMDTYRAKLGRSVGQPGTRYSLEMTIPMDGRHAVRAFHYRGGKLVKRSKVNAFDVRMATQTIIIAADKTHADVTAPADTPIDVVFPGTLTGCAANIAFASPALVKTSSSPLTFHSDGLPAGRYPWKCSMMNCHYGDLVVQAAGTSAKARATYSTSRPVLSTAPHMDQPFTCTGAFTPKSTSKSRATVKIILWMKSGDAWGIMDTYNAKISGGTRYSCSITIPMKGDHGVQAVQYRGGKKVSKSAIKHFTVKP